ncbi:Uncharacterised protein [Klebsiella pneumoniae]|nr:Uncharacterised protein [Klebsiella pneumoniae]
MTLQLLHQLLTHRPSHWLWWLMCNTTNHICQPR